MTRWRAARTINEGRATMLRYPNCFNILIDGKVLMESFQGLTWFPSAASKAARDHYEAAVVAQLDKVGARRTGWAVLREIFDTGKSRGKEVRITPFAREDEKARGEENAFAGPVSGPDGAARGVRPFLGEKDNWATPEDERYRVASYKGTGAG